jgi:hypothetical protein
MINKIIRNFIAKQMAGRSDDGIMITLRDPQKVELGENIMADLLMRNGFNPADITSERQLKNILNQIEAASKQTTSGIRNTKSAKVFDLEGKEIPPGSRGGPDDIAAPVQSQEETLRNMTEAEIKKNIEAQNKKGIENLKQKMEKEKARTQRISGNLRADNLQRVEIGRPKLDEDEYNYYRELLDDEENFVVKGDETRELLEAMVKESEDEVAYMKRLYDKGALDPKPGERGRKKFLDRKAQKGDTMTPEEIEELKKLSEDPEDFAKGGRAGFSEGNGVADEDAKNARFARRVRELMDEGFDMGEAVREAMKEGYAKGGIARIGLKDGMNRRTFLKFLAGAASIPIVGKILKPFKIGKTVTKVPIIKTDNVPGKPEWFDQLVNKVILEGDDVTKRFATAERQSIHQKTLDDGSVVRVTEDVDDGAVRVEYESLDNVYEDIVQMQYKKPLPDEGDPKPMAEFTTAESGPVGRADGPDDYSIDIDEVGGTSISDLTSDVSKLKEYATGQKQTLKEFVQSKKRKDKARKITEGGEGEMDAVIERQGEFIENDLVDLDPGDFASGGIARMLGE